jgi:hypothetical protein
VGVEKGHFLAEGVLDPKVVGVCRLAEAGTYLRIRREAALVAMAGERMRPPG